MFEISVEYTFAAGHALRGYKGKCENVHGHNYRVQVMVNGEQLDSTGLLMDFVDLRRGIKGLVERLDHRFLNDLAPFDKVNPSAENLAKYFSDELEPQVRERGLQVQAVTVWETDTTSATYRPNSPSR
ncbi:MAG: 6-carboxytetrahydropterin synthase QueD [Acidobacteriia bacterium]|jgi:6-pyruvoyltetrahydropterin/6-carboxytetrahydropterin synthase|nr:6-carboxytetrahydropterin synthase QueD [Terriglobia bacterium]